MAGTSLFTLIDDIATLLDDIAVMTKVAAKKTAGVVGDDLAVNAEQVTGVKADRELPVVWAVAKGSAKNKVILVPAALAISAFIPWLITPLLMLGGAYLCYEGFEKVVHSLAVKRHASKAAHEETTHHNQLVAAINDPEVDMVDFERDKIRGAIRTDFILSAEIIVIALGTAQAASFMHQAIVVTLIAISMTVGVYSLVAGIVKLDDLGLYLVHQAQQQKMTSMAARLKYSTGRGILAFAPYLMKTLSVVGTAAMFIVGGSILLHGIPGAEEWVHHLTESANSLPASEMSVHIIPVLLQMSLGALIGASIVGTVMAGSKIANRLQN